MHASKKNTEKKISFLKNTEIKFLNSWPNFSKIWPKNAYNRKKSNFRKSDFWCQKRGSREKITTGWYFLGQKLKKKRFFENF